MASNDRRLRNRKSQIKDHMDQILESTPPGFYRKHVPTDDRNFPLKTLFRSLADTIFGTQYYRFVSHMFPSSLQIWYS